MVWGPASQERRAHRGGRDGASFEAGMDVVKARSLASVGIIATGSELRDFVCRAEGPTWYRATQLICAHCFWMPVSAMYGREVQLTILRPLRPHSLDLRCALTS